MKFTEITVHTSTEGSELVADILWRYTTYGVAINDVKDVKALRSDKAMYWDYMDEDLLKGGSDVLVKAFVPLDETEAAQRNLRCDLEELKANCGGDMPLGTLETSKREVEGDDWLEIWKTHFRPLHIGKKIVVCPEWISYTPNKGEQVVLLDSNMAFGTGEHETTSMCLKLLQENLSDAHTKVCLDVGCGSGILGISALKLGFARAVFTDIDPVSIESATHNARLNGVYDKSKIIRASLLEGVSEKGDIIFANITAEILYMLAPQVKNNLNDGGKLILSGIIDSRLQKVISTFTDQGLILEQQMSEGEWYALAFTL